MQPIQLYKAYDWRRLTGRTVEVELGGAIVRRGVVDMVMPDGSGVWLAADIVHARQFIDQSEGYVLWSDDFYGGTI